MLFRHWVATSALPAERPPQSHCNSSFTSTSWQPNQLLQPLLPMTISQQPQRGTQPWCSRVPTRPALFLISSLALCRDACSRRFWKSHCQCVAPSPPDALQAPSSLLSWDPVWMIRYSGKPLDCCRQWPGLQLHLTRNPARSLPQRGGSDHNTATPAKQPCACLCAAVLLLMAWLSPWSSTWPPTSLVATSTR